MSKTTVSIPEVKSALSILVKFMMENEKISQPVKKVRAVPANQVHKWKDNPERYHSFIRDANMGVPRKTMARIYAMTTESVHQQICKFRKHPMTF